MIRIENDSVCGFDQAIRSMRNPKNSWDRSDSDFDGVVKLGENDLKLATTLANAGTEHGKFLRMINVYVDVIAPLYWISELDTYKVGTVRNSCSFMHKGVSKPFTINDFSIKNTKVYEVLNDLEQKDYKVTYPYETEEYRDYIDAYGNTYKVYRNGKIVANAFDYIDSYGTGRTRYVDERIMNVSVSKHGYCSVKLVGRHHGHMFVHRMVAEAWNLPRNCGQTQIDHLNTNKGDNSVENLEWVTPSENMKRAVSNGLYDNVNSLHHKYLNWKHQSRVIQPNMRLSFWADCNAGFTCCELGKKYDITSKHANQLRYEIRNNLDNEYLFNECYVWDRLIELLNSLRDEYLETKDLQVFQNIRCLLPQGYNQRSTYMLNYATLRAIYHQRKDHKLDEWHTFCDWIKTLPYAEELIVGDVK